MILWWFSENWNPQAQAGSQEQFFRIPETGGGDGQRGWTGSQWEVELSQRCIECGEPLDEATGTVSEKTAQVDVVDRPLFLTVAGGVILATLWLGDIIGSFLLTVVAFLMLMVVSYPLRRSDPVRVRLAKCSQHASPQSEMDLDSRVHLGLLARGLLVVIGDPPPVPQLLRGACRTVRHLAVAGRPAQIPSDSASGQRAVEHANGECPECARLLPAGAVLCTDCGFDLRIGRKWETETALDTDRPPPDRLWSSIESSFSEDVIAVAGGWLIIGLLAFVALLFVGDVTTAMKYSLALTLWGGLLGPLCYFIAKHLLENPPEYQVETWEILLFGIVPILWRLFLGTIVIALFAIGWATIYVPAWLFGTAMTLFGRGDSGSGRFRQDTAQRPRPRPIPQSVAGADGLPPAVSPEMASAVTQRTPNSLPHRIPANQAEEIEPESNTATIEGPGPEHESLVTQPDSPPMPAEKNTPTETAPLSDIPRAKRSDAASLETYALLPDDVRPDLPGADSKCPICDQNLGTQTTVCPNCGFNQRTLDFEGLDGHPPKQVTPELAAAEKPPTPGIREGRTIYLKEPPQLMQRTFAVIFLSLVIGAVVYSIAQSWQAIQGGSPDFATASTLFLYGMPVFLLCLAAAGTSRWHGLENRDGSLYYVTFRSICFRPCKPRSRSLCSIFTEDPSLGLRILEETRDVEKKIRSSNFMAAVSGELAQLPVLVGGDTDGRDIWRKPRRSKHRKVVVFVVNTEAGRPQASSEGTPIQRIPEEIFRQADEAFGVNEALVQFVESHSFIVEEAGPITMQPLRRSHWFTLLTERFPGQRWECWFGTASGRTYAVVMAHSRQIHSDQMVDLTAQIVQWDREQRTAEGSVQRYRWIHPLLQETTSLSAANSADDRLPLTQEAGESPHKTASQVRTHKTETPVDRENVEVLIRRVEKLIQQGELENAIELQEKIIRLTPNSAQAHFNLGGTCIGMAIEGRRGKSLSWQQKGRDHLKKAVELAEADSGLKANDLSNARETVWNYDRGGRLPGPAQVLMGRIGSGIAYLLIIGLALAIGGVVAAVTSEPIYGLFAAALILTLLGVNFPGPMKFK